MRCEVCGGACCEDFELPAADVAALPPDADKAWWFALHGSAAPGEYVRFDCACTKLTNEGRCGIYDKRPNLCRDMRPGGLDCLAWVRRRRTREQYERIRDEADPDARRLYGHTL